MEALIVSLLNSETGGSDSDQDPPRVDFESI